MADEQKLAEPEVEAPRAVRERLYVDDAQIAAAKLQMSIDRKFGYKTLDIIKKIAAAK